MDSEWSKLFGIGGDLSFTVSYAIANELHNMAIVLGYETYELVMAVFLIILVFAATPTILGLVLTRLSILLCSNEITHIKKSNPRRGGGRSLLLFFQTLVETARRIATSMLVQIIATSASSKSGAFRIDRILALLSVSVFFVFLQTGSAIDSSPNSARQRDA